MSDVLSRILQNALGGGVNAGPAAGRDPNFPTAPRDSGSSPLGEPRLPSEAGRYGGQYREPMPGPGGTPGSGGMGDILGGGLGGILGGLLGGMAGGMGGGVPGGLPGGLPGGMQGRPMPEPQAQPSPSPGGFGGLARGLDGMKGVALMALLAWLLRGRGGTAGVSSLTDRLRAAGLDDQVDSWVGPGANKDVRPDELARAIPADTLDEVERQTGLGRDEVLSALSQGLPGMVDRLTPKGRLPQSDDELNDVDEREVLGGFGKIWRR
jgi:uncharacterized protein YidB (DUF937 family)